LNKVLFHKEKQMQIVYAQEDFPGTFARSLFLAGPAPRSGDVESWRPEALEILRQSGYNGVVFVPELRAKKWNRKYQEQIAWEEKALSMSDCIIFWIPRELVHMPAFTTNIEYGEWFKSGKVVMGSPKDAPKMSYLRIRGEKYLVPQFDTLKETILAGMDMIKEGAMRSEAECQVPLYVWKTSSFQTWYRSQILAGNRLDGAKLEWIFLVGPKRNFVFLWILHVDIFVASENRNKSNEIIVGRPDISTVMLFKKGCDIPDTDIVLIREFRSPARTSDGFIRELPGGSSFKENVDPLAMAASEVWEETGIDIRPEEIQLAGTRQLAGTLSTHKAYLFTAEISESQLEAIRQKSGERHGTGNSERTYVEIHKVREIMDGNFVDWSMLGMILSALFREFAGSTR
jgi:8-oxo-dGTP pyrophosphatase MutT (NUDIX family)